MKSREIIHQFVNMARHPEAKDLAEALEGETKYNNCLIEYKNYQYQILDQYKYNKNGLFIYIKDDNMGCQGTTFISKEEYKILGRPITAFDVCWALNKKQSEHHYFADECGISDYYSVYRTIQNETLEFETIKPDGTHTTLEDWDNKICKTIARYFKK